MEKLKIAKLAVSEGNFWRIQNDGRKKNSDFLYS